MNQSQNIPPEADLIGFSLTKKKQGNNNMDIDIDILECFYIHVTRVLPLLTLRFAAKFNFNNIVI